jgi:hypothetical protein
MRMEIETDPENMLVKVGSFVEDRPQLIHSPEFHWGMKEKVTTHNKIDLPEGYHEFDPKARNAFFAEHLGPKFNRRMQAAHYSLWMRDRYLASTVNMLRQGGIAWRRHSNRLAYRAHGCQALVNQAERDGLTNIIPAIICWKMSPQELRAHLGKGLWKRIAGHSKTRNIRLLQVTSKNILEGASVDEWGAMFTSIMEFPLWSWGALQYPINDVSLLAAKLCDSHENDDFWDLRMTVEDTKRMLNGHLNPKWTMAQLTRAHEEARHQLRRRDFDVTPFAADWSYSSAGFTASLLTSEMQIAEEGDQMHHCVASYAKVSKEGRYAVLKVQSADERATCGLTFDGSLWHVQQVYRARNEAVSDKCRAFAIEAGMRLSIAAAMRKAA